MRGIKRKIIFDKETYLFCFLLVIFLFLSMLTGCANMQEFKHDNINNISFSPDSKKLLFSLNRGKTPYDSIIHTYDIENGELIGYKPPVGEWWDEPQYSFDGKHIVFVTVPLIYDTDISHFHPENESPTDVSNESQIAIMDADGKNVRKITKTLGMKSYPSFSHSGKKIIFARADEHRTRPHIGWNWAVYEADVKTGKETCITQFKFMSMSRPYSFPDDKTFIFWGDYLTLAPGMSDDNRSSEDFDKVGKIREELRSKYHDNNIYVMKENEKKIKPYLVMTDYYKKFKNTSLKATDYSRDPSLSADGSVLIFSSVAQLFQYSADGNHRKITDTGSQIEATVSPHGELIAAVQASSSNINKITIYRVQDGTIYKKITLPDQPSRIINGQ